MRCVCGEKLDGHVCTLSHRERMIRYADYCMKNNNGKIISYVSNVTPFAHNKKQGCVCCGEILTHSKNYYASIYSQSKKYYGLFAKACDDCYDELDYKKYFINNKEYNRIYCFVNMEIPSVCRTTKHLRLLIVRELYNQHKVPRDIRNLINSLLSCSC